MCLLTTQPEPLIAEENIRVWKYINKRGNPFVIGKDYRYRHGYNYPDGMEHIEFCDGHKSVGQGFLHAYKVKPTDYDEYGGYSLVEMIVPKGTEYYTDLSGRQLCAKCLYYPYKYKKLRKFFGLKTQELCA